MFDNIAENGVSRNTQGIYNRNQPFASRKRTAALHHGDIINGKLGLFGEVLLRHTELFAAFFYALADAFIYHKNHLLPVALTL